MGTLPNTLIAGVAKSGTTSLCEDLARHNDVYLYHSKETNYFSFNFHRGEDWFRALFAPGAEHIILDGSADYTARGHSAEIFDRIQTTLPTARLIFMARHPIARAESHYVQELANGRDPLPFTQALEAWNLIDASLYEKATKIILERFAPEQLHTLFFEDYLADKEAALKGVFDFLNLADAPACYTTRRASNTRQDKIVDPKGLKRLRHMPGYYRLKGLVPQSLKTALKRQVSKKVNADIHWTPEAWDTALSRIAPDSAAFLIRHGKDLTFWDLSPPAGA